MNMVTLEKVVSILNKVQKLLRIQDWQINAHVASQKQIKEFLNEADDDSRVFGCIKIHSEFRVADMYIWKDLESDPLSQGLEFVIIHECLHIVLFQYDRLIKFAIQNLSIDMGSALEWRYSTVSEEVINQLANGFVSLLKDNSNVKSE